MKPKTFVITVLAAWLALFAKSLEFEPPYFRPWEALRRGPVNFAPNRRMESDEFGALSYRAWLKRFQLSHRTVFTTDRWGFRNHDDIPAPRIVVIGDSFVVGLGVSDEETLSSRLSVHLGEPVYNYGADRQEGIRYFLADPRFVHNPPVLVIWALSDPVVPVELPKRVTAEELAAAREAQAAPSYYRRIGAAIDAFRNALDRDNGLGRFAKFTYHEVEYLLFGFENQIQVDGSWALVESISQQLLDQTPEQRKLEETVASYVAFKDALAERGIRMIAAPIPGTGTIYPDLFPDHHRIHQPPVRDLFLERLQAERVETIDLAPALRANRSPYLYIRDDTHWNPRGIEVAARAIAEHLRQR